MFSSATLNVLFVMGLVILFFWLLFKFMSFTTGFLASKFLRGRKIFIGQSGDTDDKLKLVECLVQQGAIIADDASDAEFQLILSSEMMRPKIIVCRLSDREGVTKTLKQYQYNWPKPLVMDLANFVRVSDLRPVRRGRNEKN